MADPILRYMNGIDMNTVSDICNHFAAQRGTPMTEDDWNDILGIISKHAYNVPFWAMPIEEGVQYATFLVQLCVNHQRFVGGAPLVGGRVNIGKVTYKGERFGLLEG